MPSARIRREREPEHRAKSSPTNEFTSSVRARAPALADMLVAFFSHAGMQRREIVQVLTSCASRLDAEVPDLRVESWSLWAQLGNAVGDWWRDARYVGSDGRPIALVERGAAPSVDALLEKHVDCEMHERAKAMLKHCVSVGDDQRWRFVYDSPVLPLRGEQGVHRLHVLMTGLLRTFLTNSLENLGQNKCFDKSAGSVSFPTAMLPAFRVRMKKCLDLAIEDADAWITRHSNDATAEPVCEVGVEMFVFDFAGESSRTRRTPAIRSGRHARARAGCGSSKRGTAAS